MGHRTIRGHSHTVFGRVELADGRIDDAYAHFTAALPFHIELGDGWGIMLDVEGFAAIATRRHRYADAARLLGASDHHRGRDDGTHGGAPYRHAGKRHGKAVEAYRRVLARDELHEDAVRALMRALAEAGERSQAMRMYQRFADRLRAELDAEPDRETKRLFERLHDGAASVRATGALAKEA